MFPNEVVCMDRANLREYVMIRASKIAQHTSVMAALVVLAAACGSTKTTKPAAPDTTKAAVTTSTMDSHMAHSSGAHDHPKPVIPKPLALLADGTVDPAKVDLSGIPGVTPAQQAKAEALVRASALKLPKWKNYDDAIADGFKSIGDGITGEEHVIRYDWIEDDVILDPTAPESLVYKVERKADGTVTKTLEAAMYLLPSKYTLKNPPDVGGALMQYHIHNYLCFTVEDAPQVRGITDGEGKCPAPLVKGNENTMIHVWIIANRCGPFAALDSPIAAGQTASGQRDCDAGHGGHE